MKIHKYQKHSKKILPCKICGKMFQDKTHLKKHLVSHSSLLPFQCCYCNLSYKRKKALSEHINNVHFDGKKLIKCEYCDAEFLTNSNLNRHIKSNHEKVIFQCDVCGAKFTRRDNLQRHSDKCHS